MKWFWEMWALVWTPLTVILCVEYLPRNAIGAKAWVACTVIGVLVWAVQKLSDDEKRS